MKVLQKIMKAQRDISIRVLATDPLADSPLRKIAQWQLHVPYNVSGTDTFDVDETTHRLRKGFEDNKEDSEGSEWNEDEESEDSSSDESSEDEDDDEDDEGDTDDSSDT